MKIQKILFLLMCLSVVFCYSCSDNNNDDDIIGDNNNNLPVPNANEKFLGTYSGDFSCSNGTNYGTITLTVTAGAQPNEIIFDGSVTATVSGNNFSATNTINAGSITTKSEVSGNIDGNK